MGIDIIHRKNTNKLKFKDGHKELKRVSSPDKIIKPVVGAVLAITTLTAVKKLLE